MSDLFRECVRSSFDRERQRGAMHRDVTGVLNDTRRTFVEAMRLVSAVRASLGPLVSWRVRCCVYPRDPGERRREWRLAPDVWLLRERDLGADRRTTS